MNLDSGPSAREERAILPKQHVLQLLRLLDAASDSAGFVDFRDLDEYWTAEFGDDSQDELQTVIEVALDLDLVVLRDNRNYHGCEDLGLSLKGKHWLNECEADSNLQITNLFDSSRNAEETPRGGEDGVTVPCPASE